MSSIAIIDYEMGNLHSIAKAVEHVAGETRVLVTSVPEKILAADRVIFPGVGGIGHCMESLLRRGLDPVIREVAASGKPLLGICLGMQAMLERSEENGGIDCLGLIKGEVRRFSDSLNDNGVKLKVPHMGWNQVHQQTHPLWQDIDQDSRFYFVHSYYAIPAESADCAGVADYGGEFCCTLARENLFAVQFHPEKSQHAGLTLLRNFSRWDGRDS
ncbi:glutamine amidotransferase [Thiogranum longum]|uniref:Imidazole glycerol phosphate synthase subunit HisH n=1 Tax=Thiogranum longum TaxID=1537524 RepID=A0A4R1HFS4_9GAMM|nr:imidazole glycerol phosphate synthase subunit HisH [Thiogranum longum]TCK19563.1 glutamine amidotransferase [Thiogranum longum]